MLDAIDIADTSQSVDTNWLEQSINDQKLGYLDIVSERNNKFFDEEMIKLDKWAEDRKNSLEMELKQLDKDIKTQKTEAKKILKLGDKVKIQKIIKEEKSVYTTFKELL